MTVRPRAYSYVRMSTETQLRGDSLRRQLAASQEYADRMGLQLADDAILQDIGVSGFKGRNVTQGALGRFLDAVRAGKIEPGSTLIVESLDRISRQEIRKALSVFLDIINANINIVTLADGHVYTAEKTELVDLITSLVGMSRAHDESRTKSLRVGAAWASKRAGAKRTPMTAISPAWLRLSRDRTRYELIQDRANLVRLIFEESAAGIGNYTITRRLNERQVPSFGRSKGWHRSYVSKVLKNRAVLGEFPPHKMVNGERRPDGDPIQDYFPRVVDDGLFYQAQLGLSQRLNHGAGRKGTNVTNLFSGLVCAYCRGPVKFENKGQPPKGGHFLVCDNARRGLGCVTTRWRYDHFETSFLAFVRELNLGTIIHDEDDARKRSILESTIAALQGELTAIRAQMDRTYELLDIAGTASAFVAEKLQQLEQRRSSVDAELVSKERELSALAVIHSPLYDDRDQLGALIDRLRGAGDDDTYRLRAQVASRLRTIVTHILIGPAGSAPSTQKAIDAIASEPEAGPVIDHLRRKLDEDRAHRRYFIACFSDETFRIVYPNRDDALKFEEQLISAPEGLVAELPESTQLVFPSRRRKVNSSTAG